MLDSTDSTAAEQVQQKRHIPMTILSANRSGSNTIFNNPRIVFSSIPHVFNRSIPSTKPQIHFVGKQADDMLLISDGSQSGKDFPCSLKHMLMFLEQILQICGIDVSGLMGTLCQLIEIVAVPAQERDHLPHIR